jgi:transcriptional regulator with PAS, ATPase and Fis domain
MNDEQLPQGGTLIGSDPRTVVGVLDGEDRNDLLPVFVLKVEASPEPLPNPMFALDWTQFSRAHLGTSSSCELALRDRLISRRHISLSPKGGVLRLVDLGSKNGTYVGKVQVLEAYLRGGEVITIGETQIKVMRTGAVPNPMTFAGAGFGRVLGQSSDMQRVFVLGERLAKTRLPVVIEGETGTGKDLFAEAMHDASSSAAGPMITLSAHEHTSKLDEMLRTGSCFVAARNGTLVLDEPSELPEAMQTQLVRLCGAHKDAVRFITTTRRSLERDVEAGRLREDLLFALTGARIELPPLRDRHGDIAILAAHFYRLAGGEGALSQGQLAQLHDYRWPGNVREFRHAVESIAALGSTDHLAFRKSAPREEAAFKAGPSLVDELLQQDLSLAQARTLLVADFELKYVQKALGQHNGNVTRAAAASGLTRRYFHMLLAKQKLGKEE